MIRFIALFFLALTMQTASAQDYNKKEVCIRFRVASSVLDTKFADNEANLNNVIEFLNEVTNDTTLELTKVTFCGSASPEGGNAFNRKLAKRRCANMEQYVPSASACRTASSYVRNGLTPGTSSLTTWSNQICLTRRKCYTSCSKLRNIHIIKKERSWTAARSDSWT